MGKLKKRWAMVNLNAQYEISEVYHPHEAVATKRLI